MMYLFQEPMQSGRSTCKRLRGAGGGAKVRQQLGAVFCGRQRKKVNKVLHDDAFSHVNCFPFFSHGVVVLLLF